MKYTIYWTDKLNRDFGDEYEEFNVNAKDKKEARIKGRIKALKIQLKEYKFRKKEDITPLIKKPKLSDIQVTDVEEY